MSKFFSVTFHHPDMERARRAIERERAAGVFHRALLWDCGRMGVITRFYTFATPDPAAYQDSVTFMRAVHDMPENKAFYSDRILPLEATHAYKGAKPDVHFLCYFSSFDMASNA